MNARRAWVHDTSRDVVHGRRCCCGWAPAYGCRCRAPPSNLCIGSQVFLPLVRMIPRPRPSRTPRTHAHARWPAMHHILACQRSARHRAPHPRPHERWNANSRQHIACLRHSSARCRRDEDLPSRREPQGTASYEQPRRSHAALDSTCACLSAHGTS